MLLLIDNRDSFTHNVAQALLGLGATVEVRRAGDLTLDDVSALAPERVVLGPGPGRPESATLSIELVRALGARVPILGVCLGHQAIGVAFGARIVQARTIVHGRAVAVSHAGDGLFDGLPDPLACGRYNSLSVDSADLPAELEVTARSEDGDVMALRHRSWPLAGVQFHPESILSAGGARFFENFLRGPRR